MIVDAHAHLWGKGFIPPAFYEETARKWAKKSPDRKPEMIMPKLLDGIVDEDGKLFIENMDRAGVDVTILNMTDFGRYWSGAEPEIPLEEQVEFYAELNKKYPNRLYFFAFFDPRRKNHVDLFERAVLDYGCIGCGELSPHGFKVTDEIVQPLFKKCMELSVPVFIHTRVGHGTEMKGEDYTLDNEAHPFHVRALQAAYPDLIIILGHAGYDLWWAEASRIAIGNPNCYLDLSDWDSELSEPGAFLSKLASMRDMVGADHILFGSDQTSGKRFCGEKSLLPNWVAFMKNLTEEARTYGYKFSKEEVQLILGDNAKRIMNL